MEAVLRYKIRTKPPLEKEIKNQILLYLRDLEMSGHLCVFDTPTSPIIVGAGRFKRFKKNPAAGFPDIMVLLKQGPVLFLEIKRPNLGRQSPKQVEFQSKCEQMGHFYSILTSKVELIAILKRVGIQPIE